MIIDVRLESEAYDEGKDEGSNGDAEHWDNPYSGPDDWSQQFIDWYAGWCFGRRMRG